VGFLVLFLQAAEAVEAAKAQAAKAAALAQKQVQMEQLEHLKHRILEERCVLSVLTAQGQDNDRKTYQNWTPVLHRHGGFLTA
jgi:uncharacterized protein YigA (DUF484 family)